MRDRNLLSRPWRYSEFRVAVIAVLVGGISCATCRILHSAEEKGQRPIVSNRIVLDDGVFCIVESDNSLFLTQQVLQKDGKDTRSKVTFRVPAGHKVNTISLAQLGDSNLTAVVKTSHNGSFHFHELNFALHRQQPVNGMCNSYTFYTTHEDLKVLAVNGKNVIGVMIVLGQSKFEEDGGEGLNIVSGVIFHDGCPMLGMGGSLSKFKTESIPLPE